MREIEGGRSDLGLRSERERRRRDVGRWVEGAAPWLVRCIHSILFSLAHAAREGVHLPTDPRILSTEGEAFKEFHRYDHLKKLCARK